MEKRTIHKTIKSAFFLFLATSIFQSYIYADNGGEKSPLIILATAENLPASGTCDGTWDDPGCWVGSMIPAPGDDVNIVADILMDVNAEVSSLTISTGIDFTVQAGQTLTVRNNGFITADGTFMDNGGTVFFIADGTVSGTAVFNDVVLDDGGVDFGTNSTLNGTLTIESNGFVNANSPTYGPSSTLKYNAGGIYGRRSEWDSKNPHHVQILNGTSLDLGANGGTGAARTMNGNLTVDSGCGFFMDYSSNDMTQPLNVVGNIENNGTFSLSNAIGGDLNVGGDFTQNGPFNCNERAVQFNGAGSQNLGGAGTIFIDYLDINTGGQVSLGKEVTVDNELRLNAGKVNLGAFDLTLNGGLVGGSDGSYVITSGGGVMKRNIGTGGTFLMPIGVSGYNPFYLENNGSTSQFSGHVEDGVSGVPYSAGIVERLWEISDLDGMAGNVTVTLQWNSGDGINGFNDALDVIIGHESGGGWMEFPATKILGPPNTASATGFNSFSPFVVANSGALPVELEYFGAAAKNNSNLLTWRTLSETNNSHFGIERSADAQNWKTIGRVEGSGNSRVPHEYTFADQHPLNGQNYYRLRQTDFDGSTSFSKIILVKRAEDEGFQIYPNPLQDELFLAAPSANEDVLTTRIFNVHGQLLASQNWKTGEAISTEDLLSGVYFLEIWDESGRPVLRERFVKK